jgi:hypothetical protein
MTAPGTSGSSANGFTHTKRLARFNGCQKGEKVFYTPREKELMGVIRDRRKLECMGGREVLLSNDFAVVSPTAVEGKSIKSHK